MIPSLLVIVGLIFLYIHRATAFTFSFDFFWPMTLIFLGLLAYLHTKRT